MANINPFRYRSYYYDKETKLYYLNSRYYNPLWGRFLNGDNIFAQNNTLLGNNLYLYCNNNPINCIDSNGRGPILSWINNNIIKPTAKGITGFLSSAAELAGLKKSSTLLYLSTQDNPKDLHYNSKSTIAKDIQKSSEFKKLITQIATDNLNSRLNNQKYELGLNSPDLFLSLHRTSMYVSGQLINGSGNLSITIKDRYDFDYMSYMKYPFYKWPINFVNNIAYMEQELEYIQNYNITVEFDYCVNCN